MTNDEYFERKRQIRVEYLKKLEALETAYEMSDRSPASPSPALAEKHSFTQWIGGANFSAEGKRYGDLVEKVRDCVSKIEGRFTPTAVRKMIRPERPDVKPSSVSVALGRLAHKGEIAIVEKGSGKRATVYQKVVEVHETSKKSPPAID